MRRLRWGLAVLVLTASPACGGRVAPPDAGPDSGEGGDAAENPPDGSTPLVHCYDEECPWELPYCCEEHGYTECTDDPDRFLDEHGWEAGCGERLRETAFVEIDCVDGGYFHSERCPAGFPHCCVYAGPREVCVDHLPVGYRCDR